MKYAICVIAAAVLLLVVSIQAMPQPGEFRKIPRRHPAPSLLPRPIRVRRQSLGGTISANPAGGQNVNLGLSHGIGTPDHNLMGKVFAAGNTNGGPVTTGAGMSYNINGHGLDITKTHTPGGITSLTESAHANLFNNGVNSFDAKVFASQNELANGFKFERNGGGLEWNNVNGHGANAGLSHIPNFGNQLELGAKANLWQSADRATRLDLTGSGSKWLSGPLSGQTNYGAGLGLTHIFG